MPALTAAEIERRFQHCASPLPTQYDLPCADGVPLDSERSGFQQTLLVLPLRLSWAKRPLGYVGQNMFLYFDPEQTRGKYIRGPDVFVVVNGTKDERLSWVLWVEKMAPDVLIELLSPTTRSVDKHQKKDEYERVLQAPEYYWYDPFTTELAGFRLTDGVYAPIVADALGRLHSEATGLYLVTWTGTFVGITATWLRWADADGVLLPTGEEVAEQERARAQQERARAEQAERRIAQLEAMLRHRPGNGNR